MKIFKFMAIALVAMFVFTACDNECEHELNKACEHEYIEVDYSKALVGTWTCMDMDYAEALVIKADGSVEVTGVVDGEYFESKGTIKVVNNKMTYTLDNGDEWEGRFEMTAGESFTMVWDDELDIRYTYRYCENDLADEVVGMWVCNDGPSAGKDMAIITYSENGKMTMTTESTSFVDKDLVNVESDYVVVGDLIFKLLPKENVGEGYPSCIVSRVIYTQNGTSLGDILTETSNLVNNDFEVIETTSTFLRVKQSLNLTGKTYDYSSAYVTNAKGTDEDFSILGHTFNIAKIGACDFDMMLRSVLFCLDTDANSIKQHFLVDGVEGNIETPITVVGNKVTIDYSDVNPALRKVEMYMYQDADDSQLHMYMHTDAFINYFANLEVVTLLQAGKIDQFDEVAIAKVFADMEERVESINVSFVLKARN